MAFHLVLLSSVVLATLAGAASLFLPRALAGGDRPRVGVARVLAATVAVAALALAHGLAGAEVARSLFALPRVGYHVLLCVLPTLGAALLAAGALGRRRVTGPARLLALLALAGGGVALHARFVAPFDLQLVEVRVPLDPARAGRAPLRIGVLSDLQTEHVGAHERAAVRLLMEQEPDLILLPGDLLHATGPASWREEAPAVRALLAELHAPGGVFFVEGNVDTLDLVDALLEGTEVRRLVDEEVTVRIADRVLRIGGLDLSHHRLPAGRALIATLEQRAADAGEVRLLLSHLPDAVLELAPSSRIDLVVAGHTHGGQVRLPLFGPPVTLSAVPRAVAAGDLHDLDGRRVHVSRGVGLERDVAPRIRFLTRPEVVLLHLE